MTYLETKPYKTTAGYLSERRFYECTQCAAYCRSNQNAQRQKAIGVSRSVLNFSVIASKPKKTCFPSRASHFQEERFETEPETVFGDIKHNRGFRRFGRRVFEKI